jgi:hypothetical protein
LYKTPLPYLFSYPSTQTNLYNGDFNREDAIRPNNYPTKRFIDVCNIMPLGSYNFRITSCSYGGMQTVINEDATISSEVKEGETFDVDFEFDKVVRFVQSSSSNKSLGNVIYRLNGTSDGYSLFIANGANLMFTISQKSANDFDVYTRLPKLIRVLPYTADIDGITYFKTTTPNGEIKAEKNLDDAINTVTFYEFSGEFSILSLFFGDHDVVLPEGLEYREELRDNYDNEIWGRFLYNTSDESYVTSDSDDFAKVVYMKSLDDEVFKSVKAFSVLVDRVYINNTDNKLISKIRTIETSEFIDVRNILLKFDSGTADNPSSYVELRNLETEVEVEEEEPVTNDTTDEGSEGNNTPTNDDEPSEETEEGTGESKVYTQTVSFQMCIKLSGDPSTDITNQVFVDFSNMSFSFMFRKDNGSEDEYFVDCSDVRILNEETYKQDGKILLQLKMKWSQEMGIMNDETNRSGRWRCYMLAKTSSGFSYRIGEFLVQAPTQVLPTDTNTPQITIAYILN